MITEAYIAGAVERAIFKKEDEYFILERSGDNGYHSMPINHFDLNSFTLAKPEITHYNNIEWETERLYSELNNDAEKHNALNMFLMGMDKSLSYDLRREAMEMLLACLISKNEVKTFLRNRIFATKVPAEFDADSAFQIAENIGDKLLAKWYKDLSHANKIIIAVRDTWKKTIINQGNQTDLIIEVLDKEFTDRGIFSDFVLALLYNDDQTIDNAIVIHADKLKELKIGQPAVFLATLKQMVYNALSIIQEEVDKVNLEEIKNEDKKYDAVGKENFVVRFNTLIDNFKGKSKSIKEGKRGKRIKTILLSRFFKEININEQVAWIKERINERNIESAEDAILKLIEHQNLHSEPEHLCKSLSDIADCFQKANLIIMSDCIAQKAIDLFPVDSVPYCIIAENFRAKGQLEDAIIKYEEIIRDFKNDAVPRTGKAETLRQMGRLKEALTEYEETIRDFKEEVYPRNGKAETLRQMGRLEEALTEYEETIRDFKNDVVPRNGKAETLRQIGRLDEALNAYEETICDFKDEVYPRNGKAETLRQMGRLEEAMTAYEETIRDFKEEVYPRTGKAETLRQMGRLEEALTAYEEIIRDFKNDAVPRTGKAETLRQMGRMDEAKAMFDKIINEFPYDFFAKIARIVLLIQIGKNLNELEKQIQVPNPQSKEDWILNHVHCMLLIKLNKIDEAISKLEHGVENIKDIEQLNYYNTALSYAYIKKRKFKDAVAQFNKEMHPRPVFQVLVTHAYAADGNLEESKMHYNSICKSPIKKIEDTSKYLSDRYHLVDQHFFTCESKEDLEKKIEDLEFDLLTEPLLIAA
ncbi:MAG: tetratricopeptide repeat protein [Bacteroidales bacterium]|nr:tetratricopeptide repeat protein [Bacteroidales bacterium]